MTIGTASAWKRGRGLFGLIRQIDSRRNEIVHWFSIRPYGISPTGFVKREEYLASAIAYHNKGTEQLTTASLIKFQKKCEFISTSIYHFHRVLEADDGGLVDDGILTWREIFQQPATYPPQDSHPLSPKRKVP